MNLRQPYPELEGVFVVVPTPMDPDEALDLDSLRTLVDHYIEAGVQGLVVLGSGGEFAYLHESEKLQVAATALEATAGRVPVVVGVGATSAAQAESFVSRCSEEHAPAAFLVTLTPYYDVSFSDGRLFFERILAATEAPLLYYHFPQVTGFDPSPKELAALLTEPRIVGIKESGLNLKEMRKHVSKLPAMSQFSLFSGTSFLITDTVAIGGAGVICPIPSIAPKMVLETYEAATSGDAEAAARLQAGLLDLLPFMNDLDGDSTVQSKLLNTLSRLPFALRVGGKSRHAVIKEVLRQQGLITTSVVRAPLPQVTDSQRRRIAHLLGALDLR